MSTGPEESLLPPNKRSRPVDNMSHRYILNNDVPGLIQAVKELLVLQRPDLIESFVGVCQRWQAPAARWPASQLSTSQQRLATDGFIMMDNETQRWNVRIAHLFDLPATEPVAPERPPPVMNDSPWIGKLTELLVAASPSRGSVWQGMLARNEKKKTPIVVTCLGGDLISHLGDTSVLSVSLRSPYDEMLKKDFLACGLVRSTDQSQVFFQYRQYFEEKNRAGVVRVPHDHNIMLYIMPLSAPGLSEALSTFRNISYDTNMLFLLIARASEQMAAE